MTTLETSATAAWTQDEHGYWLWSPQPRVRALVTHNPVTGIYYPSISFQNAPEEWVSHDRERREQWIGESPRNWQEMTTLETAIAWCESKLPKMESILATVDAQHNASRDPLRPLRKRLGTRR